MGLINEHPIVIVCAADNSYSAQLAAMLKSLSSNLKTNKEVFLYIISDRIKEKNKKRIINTISKSKLNIVWIEKDTKDIFNLMGTSKAYYLRLFIPRILPSHFKKCIYLDSDLIVSGNIEELWEHDYKDLPLCAAQDPWSPTVSCESGLLNYKELKLDPSTKYLNSGVLIYNLDLWRKEDITSSVIKYISENEKYIRWWDQDGLNAILPNRWVMLDRSWNYIASPILEQEQEYIDNSKLDSFKRFKIIHYAGWIKPWYPQFKHPAGELYFKYLDMTDWAGLRPANNSQIFRRAKNKFIYMFGAKFRIFSNKLATLE